MNCLRSPFFRLEFFFYVGFCSSSVSIAIHQGDGIAHFVRERIRENDKIIRKKKY